MGYQLGRCYLDTILHEIGWSQKDLSDYTEIDKTTLSKYVKGSRIISYLNSIIITETIYERTGKRYSPSDLYEVIKTG